MKNKHYEMITSQNIKNELQTNESKQIHEQLYNSQIANLFYRVDDLMRIPSIFNQTHKFKTNLLNEHRNFMGKMILKKNDYQSKKRKPEKKI